MTNNVEKKKAYLVVNADNVDPIELVMFLSFQPSAGRRESHTALSRTSPGFEEFAEGIAITQVRIICVFKMMKHYL